jgi:hypothetical protein
MSHKRSTDELITGFAGDTIKAAKLMYENDLYGQLMVIIYSAIDSMGLLDAAPTVTKATGGTFKAWVKKYMLSPGTVLDFNEVDLWGARCGVLHTFTTQSDLSDGGKAKQIQYYSGAKDSPFAKAFVTATKEIDGGVHVPAHIEDTLLAFCDGVRKFAADLQSNCKTNDAYEARLNNVLQQYQL